LYYVSNFSVLNVTQMRLKITYLLTQTICRPIDETGSAVTLTHHDRAVGWCLCCCSWWTFEHSVYILNRQLTFTTEMFEPLTKTVQSLTRYLWMFNEKWTLKFKLLLLQWNLQDLLLECSYLQSESGSNPYYHCWNTNIFLRDCFLFVHPVAQRCDDNNNNYYYYKRWCLGWHYNAQNVAGPPNKH